ncbi:MAG: nitroreductase family protein [Firmicutes bacterium]|nr:nitroreductase family protein [Bacillota bacterium]
MDLITGIKERRSIRKFQDKKVPHEVIEEIVNVAAYAPSWKNTQIARYIVVEDPEKIAAIATEDCTLGFTYNIKTMANAPALVLLTMVKGRSGFEKDGSYTTPKGDRWEMFDAGIAAQTFCLAAHEKGIGTVIMGIFDENKVAEIVEIPEGQQLAAIIPIGYPVDGEVAAPPRKTAEQLLSFVE